MCISIRKKCYLGHPSLIINVTDYYRLQLIMKAYIQCQCMRQLVSGDDIDHEE